MGQVSGSSYFICGTPRVGSTLLCGMLLSTGVAGNPESYFRAPDQQSWADRWHLPRTADGSFDHRDYVRAAVSAGSTPNGVFAARVMWGSMEPLVAGLRTADPDSADSDLDLLSRAFGRPRFVHLLREDTLAQAVSWARAEQTGHWQDDDPASGREPRFDRYQIHDLVDTIDAHIRAWRQWFARIGVTPHEVHYEGLTDDPTATTGEILQFLELRFDGDQRPRPRTARQADDLNADWTARYRSGR